MARYFSINTAQGMSTTPKLDSQGCATVQFTVTNVSGADLDGRAALISLPVVDPPAGAVQNNWVKIDGPAEQRFEQGKEKPINVKIAVPKKDKPKPGTYQFRLEVASVAVTDRGDSSPVIAFTVPEVHTEPSKFPLWLIPVIAVIVIGLGAGLWLALRPKGTAVPDLSGQTITAADTSLKALGFALDSNPQTIESKPADSGKILSQVPKAGTKAPKGQKVQVTLGANMVTVPQLIGQSFDNAKDLLSKSNLSMGTPTTAPNANFNGGVVWDQNPVATQVVKAGQSVDVHVTPQTIAVVSVVGQQLGTAITNLKGLNVTGWTGDSTKTIVGQNPAAGTSVPVGTAVTLNFEIGACLPGRVCLYEGRLASTIMRQQYLQERLVR